MAETPRGMPPARAAWMGSGIAFFMVGVVFTLTMPDNIALGITFLALGVVFFSLSSTRGGDAGGGSAASEGDTPDEPSTPEPPR